MKLSWLGGGEIINSVDFVRNDVIFGTMIHGAPDIY